MKHFFAKHKKGIAILLLLILASQIVLRTHYISKKDVSGTWKLVCYQNIGDNPEHLWEGYLLYYGKEVPENVQTYIVINDDALNDEYVAEEIITVKESMDSGRKINWYTFNALSFSFPSKAKYRCFVGSDKPHTIKTYIKWTENGEEKTAVIVYGKE